MKKCTVCKNDFEIEKFAFKNKSLNIRVSCCNDCRKERAKRSYFKHHEKNLERSQRNKKSNLEWFKNFKNTLSCSICGENESSCLDFHHVDSSTKEYNVSNISDASIEKIKKELKKCSCLCANCHRKVHAGKINTPLVKLDIT